MPPSAGTEIDAPQRFTVEQLHADFDALYAGLRAAHDPTATSHVPADPTVARGERRFQPLGATDARSARRRSTP